MVILHIPELRELWFRKELLEDERNGIPTKIVVFDTICEDEYFMTNAKDLNGFVKSDDVVGRVRVYEALVKGKLVNQAGVPESFRVLVKEFQALGLDVQVLNNDDELVEFKDIEESDDNEGAPRIDEIDLSKDLDGKDDMPPEPEDIHPYEEEEEEDSDDDLEFPDVLEDIDGEEGDL